MQKILELENKEYDYSNQYHDFMKTNKYFNEKIPLKKVNTNAKIKKSLSIGICVRNCEKYCNKNFEKINRICNLFKSCNIIFYENNSKDKSLKLLKKYCNENQHAMLISENINLSLPRTVILARGRNICLNTAKIINNDIYIALDFDDAISNLNIDRIVNCFSEPLEWGALFGNTTSLGGWCPKNHYYDLWALRTYDDWMNYDCWEAKNFIGTQKAVWSHLKILPQKSKIKVISAFGGIGIYNLSKLKECYYYGWKNKKECCEHVHLNKQISKNNNLFIIGYLTNFK